MYIMSHYCFCYCSNITVIISSISIIILILIFDLCTHTSHKKYIYIYQTSSLPNSCDTTKTRAHRVSSFFFIFDIDTCECFSEKEAKSKHGAAS